MFEFLNKVHKSTENTEKVSIEDTKLANTEDILKASIIGFAVGDALGVPVEFKNRNELKNNKITDMEEYGTHYQPKGTWSDDTSMMLATMDAISLADDNSLYNKMMDNFIEWMDNGKYTPFDTVFDIGNTTRYALNKYKNNLKNGDNSYICGSNDVSSNGNGSLMRIIPAAFYGYYKIRDEKEFNKFIFTVSSLTHAHAYSKIACLIYSKYLGYLLDGLNKYDSYLKVKDWFKEPVQSNPEYSFEDIKVFDRILLENISKLPEEEIKSSGYVVDSLEATLWVILNTNNYNDAVLKAVNLGDDTDTIGALVGGLAGIIYGYDNIPNKWINDLQSKENILNLIEKFREKIGNNTKDNKYNFDLNLLDETINDLKNNPNSCILTEGDFPNQSVAGPILNKFITYLYETEKLDYEYARKNPIEKEVYEMTYDEIITSLTASIRGDRFCYGGLERDVKSGLILNLLIRLRELIINVTPKEEISQNKIEEIFEFSVGETTLLRDNYLLKKENEKYVFEMIKYNWRNGGKATELNKEISKEKFEIFVNLLVSLFNSFKKTEYNNPRILDGSYWSIYLKTDDKDYEFNGINDFPENFDEIYSIIDMLTDDTDNYDITPIVVRQVIDKIKAMKVGNTFTIASLVNFDKNIDLLWKVYDSVMEQIKNFDIKIEPNQNNNAITGVPYNYSFTVIKNSNEDELKDSKYILKVEHIPFHGCYGTIEELEAQRPLVKLKQYIPEVNNTMDLDGVMVKIIELTDEYIKFVSFAKQQGIYGIYNNKDEYETIILKVNERIRFERDVMDAMESWLVTFINKDIPEKEWKKCPICNEEMKEYIYGSKKDNLTYGYIYGSDEMDNKLKYKCIRCNKNFFDDDLLNESNLQNNLDIKELENLDEYNDDIKKENLNMNDVYVNEELPSVINNEFDYSNVIPTIECVTYLVQYCDNVYKQFLKLIEDDEKRNEPLKYEFKNYIYKKNYGNKFEIYIREKTYNNITCKDFESFKTAIKDGNLNNISSMEIKLDLDYKRGKNDNFIEHENSFTIVFKPFETIFARKSSHRETNMNQIENDINEIMKRFPVINSIFCTK